MVSRTFTPACVRRYLDHISGILRVKDLFAAELKQKTGDASFNAVTLVRPGFYAPEVMHIRVLSRGFQRRKTHMVIVVDSLWDLETPLAVKFSDDGDYETLAGFLIAALGNLPQRVAVLVWESLKFTIKEANEHLVGMVEIETLPPREATRWDEERRFGA